MEDSTSVWFPAVHIFDDFLPSLYVEKRVLKAVIYKLRETHSACQKIKWLNVPKYLANILLIPAIKSEEFFIASLLLGSRKIISQV